MKTNHFHKFCKILFFALSVFYIAGCDGVSTTFNSQRAVGADTLLSVSSSNVAWDGLNLVGTINLKATNGTGDPVAGYSPVVSVVSASALSSGFFGKIESALGFVTAASINYNILPCTASDSSGVSVCTVKIASGTGQLSLQIGGASTSTPISINLNFYAAPTLGSVSPSQVDGGGVTTLLTVTGTNFRSPMTITAGSLSCTPVNVVSSTQATCSVTTTSALGLIDFKVSNPDLQFAGLSSYLEVRDRFAPTITISSQPSSLVNSSVADIAFSVTDNVATAGQITLTCLLDGGAQACATPSLHLTGLAEGLHNLSLQASDPSGNSSSQAISWTVDTTAPTLVIDSFGLGSTPSGSTATRTLSASGAGVVAYKSVVIRTGTCATADFSAASEQAIAQSISVPISTDGSYTVCGIAKDLAGNWQSVATSSSTLVVDTTVPYIVNIAGNLSGPSNDTTARPLTMAGSTVIAYKAVALKNLSDCSTASFGAVVEAPVATPYSLTFSGDGTYLVCALGRNAAMTWQPTPTASSILTIDTSAPTIGAISLGTSPSLSTTARSIQLTGAGVVEYKAISYTTGSCNGATLAAAATTPISQLFNLSITGDATYNICAIGKDAAGNWQSSPTVSTSLIIDTVAPALSLISPATGTARQAGVTLVGTCETGLSVSLSGSGLASPSSTTCSGGAFSQAILFTPVDGSKTITLTQTDAAGNVGTVTTSFVRDSTGPAIAFTAPTANTSAQTGVTIIGTCESGLTVDLSGAGLSSPATTTCVNGAFNQAIVFTSGDGTKAITASQTDAASNVGSVSINFVKDTTAPALAFTAPAANTSAQTGVTITGTCEAGLTINLSGAGLSSPATTTCASGTFSQAIVFTSGDGTKAITASQTDAAGNIGSVSINFVKDTTAPALAFTAPAANTSAQTGVTITGTCEAGLTINLSGAGLSSPATTTCASGTFSQAIVFTSGDGTKAITASQTDAAANVGTVTINFVKDTTAPALAFTAPAANTSAQTGVTITGTCEAGLTINLSGAGLSSPATTTCASGTFSQAIVFTAGDGTKAITIGQTDAAGNSGTASINFVEDATAPVLAFTSPAANTSAQTGVTITGTCEAGLTINLSGAGLSSPATTTCASGTFSQAIVFTSGDGTKAITASQTDAAANVGTVTTNFVRDNVAPVLTFSSTAAQNQSTNTNSAAFSGNCELGLSISVSLNGTAESTTTCPDGTWSYSTAAQVTDATRTYTFTQADAATNSTTITGTWVRDGTVPALTLVQPNGSFILSGGATLSIQWTTSDANLALFPIKIEFTSNSGTSWSTIAPTLMNTGSYSWTLPSINSSGVQVRVTSSDTFGNSNAVVSPVFTIDSSPPIVTLTSLTGGQLVKGGVAQSITWTATDANLATNPIALDYSKDGGTTWTSITTGTANTGSYSWTPALDGSNYFVRVTASDTAGHSGQGVSGSAFTVDATAPSLSAVTVNGQNGGITVGVTSSVTIAWTATDLNFGSFPVALSYSADGGSTWTSISSAIANSPNSYAWSLNGLGLSNGTQYQVKVQVTDKVGNTTSLATANFSIQATAPNLTFANTVNTNLYSNTNTASYNGACSNGYSVTITGTDGTNTSVSCTSSAWTWTTGTQSSDGTITYTFAQNNGAYATSISAIWTRDTAVPVISSVSLNSGASSTTTPNITVQVVATDANMSGLLVQMALANTVSQVCPSVGTSWQSFSSSGIATLNYNLAAPNGQKSICVWVQDAAGNTSAVSKASIIFNIGTPPQIASFTVTNGTMNSNYGTTAYTLGDTVNISWTASDAEGLSNNPVFLDYTTDGSTWTPITQAYGNLSGNPTSFNSSYTGFSAPAGFFEIRLRLLDMSGNWAVPVVSLPQNASPWTVFAGTIDRGVSSGASTAVLGTTLYVGSMTAINPANGDIYAMDRGYRVVKIPSATGIAQTYLGDSGSTNLSTSGGTIGSSSVINTSTSGIVFDGGYLYILTSNGTVGTSALVWKVDPTNDTYTLYLGGGTDTSTSATTTTAFVMFENFRFDESHSMYFFSSCTSPPSSYSGSTSTVKLMKVTQTNAGAAGTISLVAGNCVNGTPVSGTLATATPMGDGQNVGLSSLAVWNNGGMIYFRLHATNTVYKIVNGTLYSTALPAFNSAAGLQYSPATGLLYGGYGLVYSFTPTATANGEVTATIATNGGTGTTCSADGVAAATAGCINSNRLIIGAGGQLYILDGATGGGRAYRIRYIDLNGKIWTVAGSLPFYGDGLNPLLSRGIYRSIYYKQPTASNLTAFPSGLYFVDPSATVFGRIQNNTVSLMWGNQSGNCAPTSYAGGYTISTGQPFTCAAGSGLGFDGSGLPWLHTTYGQMAYLDTALHPNILTTSNDAGFDTNNWMYSTPGSLTPAATSYYNGLVNNTTIKQTSSKRGFFSFGAYLNGSWTSPGPVLRFFDFNGNITTHIMGVAATAGSTADSSGMTDLTTSTFASSCQIGGSTSCHTQFVEGDATTDADDILYFSEGTKIRSITNPLNPGSQKLTTILTESSNIGNFIITPDNTQIYYTMGGYLYCYALSRDSETADCMNRKSDVTTLAAMNSQTHGPLGPPTGMTTITMNSGQTDNMTWKDSKTLLIANGTQIYEYDRPRPSAITQNLVYGVNVTKVPNNADIDAQYQILATRNFKVARMGGTPNAAKAVITQASITAANKYGIKPIFLLDVSWLVCPSDAVTFASNDPTTNYNTAYNAAYNFVLQFKDSITDWELVNEVDLKTGQVSTPGTWNVGWNASDWRNVSFNGSPDYYMNWVYTLKGVSDAVAAVNSQYGLHMRRIMNITSTHMGLLDLLLANGVNFEVISYHYYQNRNTSAYSLSAAVPGSGVSKWNMFSTLATYKRPVIIDEMNCGEIYNGAFQNASNDPLYAQCLQNLRVQIGYFKNNSQLDVEALYAYELYDEPAKASPENKFGLFWNPSNYTTYTPKDNLYLWSAFAGGTLSQAEINSLNAFGLLPLP